MLTGVPRLAWLVSRFDEAAAVWPFETGFVPDPLGRPDPVRARRHGRALSPHVLLAEAWPSLFAFDRALGSVRDEGQVTAAVAACAALDRGGWARWLSPPSVQGLSAAQARAVIDGRAGSSGCSRPGDPVPAATAGCALSRSPGSSPSRAASRSTVRRVTCARPRSRPPMYVRWTSSTSAKASWPESEGAPVVPQVPPEPVLQVALHRPPWPGCYFSVYRPIGTAAPSVAAAAGHP